SPYSKSYHRRSGITSMYSTNSGAYLITEGTTGLFSSPTSGLAGCRSLSGSLPEIDMHRFLKDTLNQHVDCARQTSTTSVLCDNAFHDSFVNENTQFLLGDLLR